MQATEYRWMFSMGSIYRTGRSWKMAHLVRQDASKTLCGQGCTGLRLREATNMDYRCPRCGARSDNAGN